jgi:hexosaminidase
LYAYNPVPAVLTAEEAKYIKGVTGAIWTEYVRTPARVEYTLLPKLLAIAELAWTPLKNKNYRHFSENRLPRNLAKLDAKGISYSVPPAIGAVDTIMQGQQFTIELKPSVEGAKIHYTIDGYPPNETDYIYTKPLTFKIPEGQQRELQTVVITPSNNKSVVTRTLMYNRPQPENNTYNTVNALIYRLAKGSFKSVNELDQTAAFRSDTTSSFEIPGLSDIKNYGVVYDGYLKLPLDGNYSFSLSSTGASQLFIDDKLIVDNDGLHALQEKKGDVVVLKGLHRVRIKYIHPGQGKLEVFITPPNQPKTELSKSLFSNFFVGRDKTGIDAE